MNVLTILGSPRLKGNTASVLERFEGLIADRYEVSRIDVVKRKINGCMGCRACQADRESPGGIQQGIRRVKPRDIGEPPGCVQQDDGPEVLAQIAAADAVVYATPLYVWSFSAQLKALIDRHYCLITGDGTAGYASRLEGKPIALLVTCDGPIAGNADLIREMFSRFAAYGQSRIFGTYIQPYCTAPGKMGAAAADIARQMEKDLVDFVLPHQ